MKRILKTTLLGGALALILSSPLMAAEVASVGEARQEVARGVAALLNDPNFDAAVRGQMSHNKAMLADVLHRYATGKTRARGQADHEATDNLRDLERQAIRMRGLDGAVQALLDLRVHGVAEGEPVPAMRNLWVAAVLKGQVAGQREVVAYDPSGAEHRFPLDQVPDVPMLVVESENAEATRAGMQVMNEVMRREGLQSSAAKLSRTSAPEELTMLTDIYLTYDGEPNLLGDAEIYAVVSGVSPEGKVEVQNVPLLYLDKDKDWYEPRQDLIAWRNYAANYVNVQIFEDDGDTNFKEIAMKVVKAVGDVSLLVSPAAPASLIISGVSKIANEVISATEGKWWQNSPDYIDSFFVIERGSYYGTSREYPLVGARRVAKMVLKPYEVKGYGLKEPVTKDQDGKGE
jgi:hypothetical protein